MSLPIYAHRGASAYALENTMEAFQKALKLGANGIELDVQCSKDGQLIVFHDNNIKRLTGVNRLVQDCSLEELQSYRLGKRFSRIFSTKHMPKLHDIIEWANKENVALNIELKESLMTNQDALIQLLKTIRLPAHSHFSSFYEQLLIIVKKHCPHIETAFLVTKKFDWTKLGKLSHIDTIHAHKKYYKRNYLKACEYAGKNIRFYSITGKESFIAQPHPSVVGWITDYPDIVAKNSI
ncbi:MULTISPECIES: glycerophosphodiester phosphodiesterase family protein [Bacillales]|uniref:Glycerophosphodiester phosphodiesterase family protein n=1 Tax=Lysinibacillus louembei TaxID=1470088 RepID=A0ABZ0RVU1_9BACI|nr:MULTISPECIES: glycerophosphodiester phosphodiesterase family protein [Bacillales]MCT6922979.1 glycerophosphodiester phosphodiesterase [Metasolibacillus sp.]MCT6939217.1 glycerophosphodiester phosphodiesterase [Metasolibacillus sp.]WPK10938.1 glycerophosphodiester phosphodiesterase family protein [Lysinibacillus louembei]